MHGGISSFRGDCALFSWVYRIAIRCAHRVRARRGEVRDEGSADERAVSPDEGELDLRRAVDRLPMQEQTLLALFVARGLTHEEIAEVLGIPVGSVWSRLHAARKRLMTLLE